jgi:hypothetical protein
MQHMHACGHASSCPPGPTTLLWQRPHFLSFFCFPVFLCLASCTPPTHTRSHPTLRGTVGSRPDTRACCVLATAFYNQREHHHRELSSLKVSRLRPHWLSGYQRASASRRVPSQTTPTPALVAPPSIIGMGATPSGGAQSPPAPAAAAIE